MKVRELAAPLSLVVNGERKTVFARPADTLLRLLREGLGLTGPKSGCEDGDCGACTVLVDGTPIKSCMALAVEFEGREITTIEGLGASPVIEAFAERNGLQCGFCTPGMILVASALLRSHPHPDEATTREWMEGNLCRCTGYEGIKDALMTASDGMAGSGKKRGA